MGERGDRERRKAKAERDAADVERRLAAEEGANAAVHRRVEHRHRQAADLHDRAAALFDAHDDPNVSEPEAIAIAQAVIGDRTRRR